MSGPDARTGPSDDGANQVWGLISTLVAGPAVWGAVGYGIDELADTSVFTPLGVVVGFLTSFYIVYAKATHQDRSTRTARTTPGTSADLNAPQHGRDELPTRDAARPDPGDVR